MGERATTWVLAGLLLLVAASQARAAATLVDLADGQVLEAVGERTAIPAGRTPDLLLVEVVYQRLAAGALGLDTSVAVLPVRGSPGPTIGVRELPIHELLQLLLLTDSRTAARSLLAAAGPGEERGRARMRALATRLHLRATTIVDDWPRPDARPLASRPPASSAVLPANKTTAADLARLAAAVLARSDVRRRLALDGVPIANGAIIARASAPLIGRADADLGPTSSPLKEGALPPTIDTALTIGARDGLELLAIVTSADTRGDAHRLLERAFSRYERVVVVRAGQRVGRKVRVRGGHLRAFTAVAAHDYGVTVRRNAGTTMRVLLQLPAVVNAPVDAEQPVGELIFIDRGRIAGAVPLVAPVAVTPSRWLDTARR